MFTYPILFFLIVALIIWQPKKIPRGLIALLSLVSLLIIGVIQVQDISQALLGNEFIKPFQIVTILITLAVITTSLDDYGFFKYASFKAILLSKNNGITLFRNFFILTIILTGFTSNDIDVLTVTPIVLWFALSTKINPIPYLFAVFVVANTSSMEFLIGNLTNIIIAAVFNLKFVDFFLIMILPTLLTLLGQYWLLRILFRGQLRKEILNSSELKKINKKIDKPIENKLKNIFLLTVLFLVIIFSALSDFLPYDIYLVTTVGALVVLLSEKSNIFKRIKALPWSVTIFALSFIVLTYKLEFLGIINLIVSYLGNVFISIWSSVFFSSLFSAISSGAINNIPSAIGLSNILYTLSVNSNEDIRHALAYGLVVGTNIGALFSPVGALATILWLNIIKKKGYNFPIKTFIYYGLIVGLFSVLIASLILAIEIYFIY